MAFSELYELAMRLDGILTGRPESETAQNARHQVEVLDDASRFVATRTAYYLSDFGYSRFYMNDSGEIFLTSNSTEAVKKAWHTAEAASAAEAFRSAVIDLVERTRTDDAEGILSAARGIVPGR